MAISLKDAMALNGTPNLTSFVELQNQCKNKSFFTSAKPINYLSSWDGYYASNTYTVSLSLSPTSIPASGGTITATYTIKKNGSALSGVKPSVSSTIGTVGTIGSTNSSGVGKVTITVASLGTTITSKTTGTVKAIYEGTSGSATFERAANSIASYGNPSFTITYPTAAWNSATTGTWYTPTISNVSQSVTYSSTDTGTITPTYSMGYEFGSNIDFSHALNSSTGAIKFSSNNNSLKQRTGSVSATMTANDKSTTKTVKPVIAIFPGSVDAYQVTGSSSTNPGGGTIPVGSYAYFYASITVPPGVTANTYDWTCKNNSWRGTTGAVVGGSYCRFNMYNDGTYSTDEVTCTITYSNNVKVSDTVIVSLIQGSSGGGSGGGYDSSDSSNWTLRRNVDSDNIDIEDAEVVDNNGTNDLTNEQNS